MKLQVAASTTPEQREESFKKWLERKRTQSERRKAEEIMRQYRDKERLEQQRQRRQREREERLAEWVKKKEAEMKCKCWCRHTQSTSFRRLCASAMTRRLE